jgi:hypothetical protein
MKSSILALTLLCAGAVFAQTPPASPGAAHHMDNLAILLDLTDAQKVQVQSVLQQEHAKMKESFEQAHASGSKPDWEQMKALHQQLQQETLQKLTPVLSAAQLKKFQVIMEEMHGHMGRMGHMQHGAPGAAAAPAPQN